MAISTAVDPTAVARVVGIKTQFVNLQGQSPFLPQRVAVVGQGNSSATYSTDKLQITSSAQAGEAYGFGSPIHLAAKQLLPDNGDGLGSIPLTVYPLDDAATGVAATGDITPAGTAAANASFRVRVNGVLSEVFTVLTTDNVAAMTAKITTAINAVLDMPVTAVDGTTQVDLTSKWEGTSANDIKVFIVGDLPAGLSFAITQLSGGLVNPDVDDALNNIGNVWETLVVNCLDVADTVTLDKYSTFGEGRWGALVRKPLIVFTGNTEADVNTATAVSSVRTTDRVNAQLVAPGSDNLPFVVAARQVARIAKVANDNPPRDYGSSPADGLLAGTDGQQWDYTQRDFAVKAGSSTVEVRDGIVTIADVVTFYAPTGQPNPAYRYVVDIVRLQNILFRIGLTFDSAEWDGAPLLPDSDPTINPSAKKPRMAKAALADIIDGLGLDAIISNPEAAKQSIQVAIDALNPNRLNSKVTVQLSGNTNIRSIDLDFGFFFGSQQTVG